MNIYKAIVIGSKSVNATGLIRSLGMAGMSVTFMSNYSKIESKYTKNYVRLPDDKSKWIKAIIEYSATLSEKPFVFATDDDTAYLLDDNCDVLKEYCCFSNAKGNVRKIADKTVMAEIAKNCGLNIADFIKMDLTKSTDIDIEFPIIIKPFAAFAGSKGDIKICDNSQEYSFAINELVENGYTEVMVQRFLKSDNQYEVGVMGISFPNGEVIIPGIIHKIRSWPVNRGSTSYAQYIQNDDAIDIDALKRFVISTGYIGIFDIEMIVSYGTAWFIEINYRNGQYGFLPTVAGYNLPYNWCLGMSGCEIEPVNSVKPVYYINERDDYLHVKSGNMSKAEWKSQFKKASAYGMYCPEDLRPFIRQYVKIPDRVIIAFDKISSLIKDMLIKEEWCVAIRKRDNAMLYQDGGLDREFFVLKNSLRYWAADPFIVSDQGKDYLFFEMFDRFKSKGLIGYREIVGGKIGKMQIAYEADCHLSFPFIFKKDDKFFMMPESSEGNTLDILETDSFPVGWKISSNIVSDRKLVDSSLFEKNGELFLFTQELKNGYQFDQLDLYLIDNRKLVPSKNNPIVISLFNSRLAGRVFENDGEIIRVSQDCSEGYGTQINFNRVVDFSLDNYKEELFKSIAVYDVKKSNSRQYFGLHTYNFNENYEVVDFKNKSKIKFGNIINVFYRIVNKLMRK